MDAIKSWAFSVCVAAVVCSIAQMIIPKSHMQKIFNLTAGVFFLSAMISPILFEPLDLELYAAAYYDTTTETADKLLEAVDIQLIDSAKSQVEQVVRQHLAQRNIKFIKILINVNTTGQSSISINECEVELPDEYRGRHEEIKTELQEELGLNFKLVYPAGGEA